MIFQQMKGLNEKERIINEINILFSTTFLFLLFAYSVVQYIQRSNKDKNELYSLISLGIFLLVFFTDFKFLDFINKQFKYLIEFLLLSFSAYLFSLIFKNSDNKWTYYLFSLFTILLFLMAILFSI